MSRGKSSDINQTLFEEDFNDEAYERWLQEVNQYGASEPFPSEEYEEYLESLGYKSIPADEDKFEEYLRSIGYQDGDFLVPEEDMLLEEFIDETVQETLDIIDTHVYRYNGIKVKIPDWYDYDEVIVCSPRKGEKLLTEDLSQFQNNKMCTFAVTNEDSFEAASKLKYAMVMNFANAHQPGGGFLSGAIAQEECLCRNSTLFSSIASQKASVMYNHNCENAEPLYSDYMLFSPHVCVFRDKKGELLKRPFLTSVATLPAPNKMGDAMFEDDRLINETMKRRIRIMLRNAMHNGNKDLVLGAWGCGVFGNDPKDVANNFRDVLVKEGYGKCFNNVRFAIYGRENDPNILAFKKVFGREIGLVKPLAVLKSYNYNKNKHIRDEHTKVLRNNKNNGHHFNNDGR